MLNNIYRKIILLLTICTAGFAQSSNSVNITKKDGLMYLSNTVVVKLKDNNLSKVSGIASIPNAIRQNMKNCAISSVRNFFNAKSVTRASLSNVLEIKYTSADDPLSIAQNLEKSGAVLWAEPHYVYKTSYLPNDPSLIDQWSLKKIMAEEAWDISQGDTSIVIGIVDTGVDWDHPDLAANIWTNYKEIPGNGIDDDHNGYVDDVRGWDFGGTTGIADNDPVEDRPDHGSHVAGIASAVTNNSTGVASIGYKCKIMPVKTSVDNTRDVNDRAYIVYGFEGIVYAVDNGAKIINCSWGGSQYSKAGKEAIDYAFSKGVLVVASAGNSSSNAPNYPACYPGVLSVASTSKDDRLSSFSSFGSHVCLSAPGEGIYSTWLNDTYATFSGTSMASPLVAGLAGLVKAKFPDYNYMQIAEQIRVNSDKIDQLNPGFENLIGYGRINAYKAVSNKKSLAVRLKYLKVSDDTPGGNSDGVFERGETISIGAKFLNVLNSFESMKISLETRDTNVVIQNGSFIASSVAKLDSFDNFNNKFTIKIKPNTPENATITFLLKYSSGDYNDYQWDSIVVNQTYQTQSSGKIALTITSAGKLGFNDFWQNTQGVGFHYKNGDNLLYEGALMFGNSAGRISDVARGISEEDSAFKMIKPFIISNNSQKADFEGLTVFNDDGAGDKKYGLETSLSSYSWVSEPYNDFIILHYRMHNKSNVDISNFYAGLYLDWMVSTEAPNSDVAAFDDEEKLGYVFKIGGNPATHVGCALISDDACNYYAINNSGGDGGVGVYAGSGGFTNQEKWLTLTNGTRKKRAENTDVSFVISSGPHNIIANDTLEVAFAIAASDDIQSLKKVIKLARSKYNTIINRTTSILDSDNRPEQYSLEQNYPNPFNPSTTINYSLAKSSQVELKIYDMLGREVKTLVNKIQNAGHYKVHFDASQLKSGVYIYLLQTPEFRESKKLMILR
ncbi:MAG: S8 family serine peptidase [Bacteroidota bacterium]|nr:S8 family serine peptidase [Bacteroidota bacterium]